PRVVKTSWTIWAIRPGLRSVRSSVRDTQPWRGDAHVRREDPVGAHPEGFTLAGPVHLDPIIRTQVRVKVNHWAAWGDVLSAWSDAFALGRRHQSWSIGGWNKRGPRRGRHEELVELEVR